MKLKIVIVDDEPTARRTLTNLLENYVEDVEVIATADDVLSGVKAINKHKPDLVFLDVRMPNYSGFSLVDYFDVLDFEVVFTTAFEQYAPRAFESGASGYLLKPIDIEDLNTVVDKVKFKFANEDDRLILSEKKSVSYNRETGITVLPSVGGLMKFHIDEILYIEADGRQVELVLVDKKKMRANLSLKAILDIFKETSFLRIHKSYIVNFVHIKKYSKGKDSSITLYNDEHLNVGKVYKESINEIISYLPK